jgi:hypothetical protein
MKRPKITISNLLLIGFVFIALTGFITKKNQDIEIGVTGQEVGKIENTGHQVQVWQVLPEFTKKANYRLSVKHAVAGAKGSFYLIAWADTNKDGKPDKEIGRSQLMTAQNAGEWSSWEFYSDYEKIFIGNTWSQTDEQVYYQQGGSLEGYKGLSSNVFYSRQFNGIPDASTEPRFTNIKLKILSETNSVIGVTDQEVNKIENTSHQVQVWEVLPEFTKKANYRLSVKHALAGAKGSFYLIAWTDTNKDGKPDKEIGRSQLITSQNAGEWSSWEFYSDYEKIFIGNTWSQTDEQVYYQQGGSLEGYKGLSSNVFYSRQFNGIPDASTGSRFTNIKLKILSE